MEEHWISKDIRKVDLTLENGTVIEGQVFLNEFRGHDSGPQRVGELLEDEYFIPIKINGEVVLVNVQQIRIARIKSEGEVDNFMMLGVKHNVRINMGDPEAIVTGEIYANSPSPNCRVKDYLNLPNRFIRLFTTDQVIYINRQYVTMVSDL